MSASRQKLLWIAALIHRVSGLVLAIFLPLHFLVLGLALSQASRLDGFLRWSDMPVVKVAEMGLVILLTVHLLGGLRLLVLENAGWSARQGAWALAAGGVSVIAGFAFLFQVL